MLNQPVNVFTDRMGDVVSVVARATGPHANIVPDPILSITHSPGGPRERTLSVVCTEAEFRDILRSMAWEVLGEEWGAVPADAQLQPPDYFPDESYNFILENAEDDAEISLHVYKTTETPEK